MIRRFAPFVLLFIVAALTLWLGIYLASPTPAAKVNSRLRVTVVNVGQGEAAFIRSPHGSFCVIGTGPPEAGGTLVEALQNAGAKQVNLLIMPYPYAEAIGSVPYIFDAFPVDLAFEPGGGRINAHITEARRLAHDYQTRVVLVRAGEVYNLDGMTIEILAPAELLPDNKAPDNSLVVSIRYGDTRFLFAGGLGKAGEHALLSRMPDLAANWLRVARSGTDEASSLEFLRQVNPEYVVLSVGPNTDSLPGKATLNRIRATGAKFYRTDDNGGQNLTFFSDGQQITTK